MHIFRHIYPRLRTRFAMFRIVMALALLALPLIIKADSTTPLVSSARQVNGVNNLEDNNLSLRPTEVPDCKVAIGGSFTVATDKVVSLSPTKGLVVYFSRASYDSAPTVIKVEGITTDSQGDAYEELGYAYLLFRGGQKKAQTHEFSDLIYPKSEKKFQKFRLTIEGTSGADEAHFSKFNLFAVGKDDPYPAGRVDPLHAADDYSLSFYDFTYKPNRGILDPRNQFGEGVTDNGTFYKEEDTPWGDLNKITDGNTRKEYPLPTFKEQPTEGTDGTQMPHVYEHTLYAMPGDVISLSPFYDLPHTDRTQYQEKYSHWYGYEPPVYVDGKYAVQPQKYNHVTDKAGNRLLDFLIDPAGIVLTKDAGYFAGENFPRNLDQYTTIDGEKYHVINNIATLNAFAGLVNSGQTDLNAILAKDINCSCYPLVKIGSRENPFRGKFNGNGYAIKNYSLSESDAAAVSGIFGGVGPGAEISNMKVIDANISTKGPAGGLLVGGVYAVAGQTAPVIIKNILVKGNAEYKGQEGEGTLGGIIGLVQKVDPTQNPIEIEMENVVFAGDVKSAANMGALIGDLTNNKVKITKCYVHANVSGEDKICNNAVDAENTNITKDEKSYFNIGSKLYTDFNLDNAYFDGLLVSADGLSQQPSSCTLHIYNRPGWSDLYVDFRDHKYSNRPPNHGWPGVKLTLKDDFGYYEIKDTESDPFLTNLKNPDKAIDGYWLITVHNNGGQQTNRPEFAIQLFYYKNVYICEVNTGSYPAYLPIPDFVRVKSFDLGPVNNNSYSADKDHALRWYGTEATFYQPMKTAYAPTDKENLELEQKEYHIAADFAHEFNAEGKSDGEAADNPYNIDYRPSEKKIYEPVIAYRHIFHIKDGRTFADAYTTDKDKNLKYIKENGREVSARADYDFQIRLTTQVPVKDKNNEAVPVKTNFYYKKGENVYDRVPYVGIAAENDRGEDVSSIFFFDGSVQTQGYRKNYPDGENGFSYSLGITASIYFTGNGGGEVFRSLSCKAENAKAGTYTVRLVALDKDGRVINISGSDSPLYLDEYRITFLPSKEASVVTEAELENNKINYKQSPGYLTETFGTPTVVVNFDQYRWLELDSENNRDNQEHLKKYFITRTNGNTNNTAEVGANRYFKWPLMWNESSYSFGYAGSPRYDYNEYVIANHSDQCNYASGNLYDRLYYDTYDKSSGKGEQGYFLYLNAASDPGVAAKLKIESICPGSSICVSAWLAEMTGIGAFEVANMCFNFVAVYDDGTRDMLHSFVSGYIDNQNFGTHAARHNIGINTEEIMRATRGRWMHVYYTFVPSTINLPPGKSVSHYELELENNCISSLGADYLIDDIRAYVIPPRFEAEQLEPICDPGQTTTKIKVRSEFGRLLDTNGFKEWESGEEEKFDIHLAVLDKKKYHLSGVNESKIRMKDSENKDIDYIKLTITNKFPTAPSATPGLNEVYYTVEDGKRYVNINIKPSDSELKLLKEYYIVYIDEDPAEDFSKFDISQPCSKYGVIELQGSGIIKIDGIAYTGNEPIEVCEGQSPVAQVELKMISKERLPESYSDYESSSDHYYDWFYGTMDEFMEQKYVGNTESCYSLLYKFRNGVAGVSAGQPDSSELPSDSRFDGLRPLVEEGRLLLRSSSFVFPPVKASTGNGEDESILTLTAVPILKDIESLEGYKVCSQPNEIKLRVLSKAPLMHDGFKDTEYLADMANVPLRIGFRQLGAVSDKDYEKKLTLTKNESTRMVPCIPDGYMEILKGATHLEVPLRKITSYRGESEPTQMLKHIQDPFVYLVRTDDPLYVALDHHPGDEAVIKDGFLLPVGIINGISASTGNTYNNVTIVFSDKMKFREGYFYDVRFSYDEDVDSKTSEGYCQGHVVFTIKVVPEYMKWTGGKSRNWNNDANWVRMTTGELSADEDNANLADFIVGAKNNNSKSYAPLDFTKVVIPGPDDASNGYPVMFPSSIDPKSNLAPAAPATSSAIGSIGRENVGIATDKIQYDMVPAYGEINITCRPWYANTCGQIHFAPGAEILNQQHFKFGENYQKAWVDVEMDLDQWHLLGSPLEHVVAGDMYTKPGIFTQNTELFTDITFDEDVYGRYKLPVYQRGWNKASTKTYELNKTGVKTNAAVELNWSRVYNDVNEDYSPGTGFSIRTATTAPSETQTVLFRLPKADDSYSYYSYAHDFGNPSESAGEKGHSTPVNRPKKDGLDLWHSLIDFVDDRYVSSVKVGGPDGGNFFLVGNPFMAHMDMATFFSENPGLDKYFWIMDGDKQVATMWDERTGTYMSTATSSTGEGSTGMIAPLQGFFVRSTDKKTELTLKFTPAMITEPGLHGDNLTQSRGSSLPGRITITAIDAEGESVSSAIINIDSDAKAAYDGSEDAVILIDRSLDSRATVYSVATGQALAINSLDAITETEIGLLTSDDSLTTLCFEGVDFIDDLSLLDTATGEFTRLYDGMTIDVKGSASGRLYLTCRTDTLTEPTLAIVCKERTVRIVSSTEGVTANIYTPDGMNLGRWTTDDNTLEFGIDPGIFLVEAVSANQRVTRKFIVR